VVYAYTNKLLTRQIETNLGLEVVSGRQQEGDRTDALGEILRRRSRQEDEYRELVLERFERFSELESDPIAQQNELAACRQSCDYWIDNWCWSYNPKLASEGKDPVLPFRLFDKQRQYLRWREARLRSKESGVVEKCRDIGASWLNIYHQFWHWLFDRGYKGTFGSRKEKLVDTLGDPDTLFEKARIMLRYLPTWMRPKDYYDGYLRFVNYDNNATITGEAGDQIGRGGRSTVFDIDEGAFIQRADIVDRAVSFNADSVFWTSTPNGISNVFAKKRHSGKIPVFRFDWFDDPRKDEAWLQRQIDSKDPITLAQEVYVQYETSSENQAISGEWIAASVNSPLQPHGRRVAALDVATSGTNVFTVREGSVVLHIESWSNLNTTQSAHRAIDLIDRFNVTLFVYDAEGLGEGIGAALFQYQQELEADGWELNFFYKPFRGSDSPSDRYWIGDKLTSKQKFLNRRAEAIWSVRSRVKNTYERVKGIQYHDDADCISYPNHAELRSQLGVYKFFKTSKGKLAIESKEQLAKRGIGSPDFFESLYMCFSEDPPETGEDAVSVEPMDSTSILDRYDKSRSIR